MINKIKNWLKSNLIVFCIITVMALFVIIQNMDFKSIGTKFIDKLIAERENSIVAQKDKDIQELNEKINALSGMLNSSDKKVKDLNKKILELQKQKEQIQKPGSVSEIKKRFKELGYETK